MSRLGSLFGKKSAPRLMGLDIASSAVKLVTLSLHQHQYALENYAIEPLPPHAVIDGHIIDALVVTAAIERAHCKMGAHCGNNVAIAVSGPLVITKQIQLPRQLSAREMEEQIFADAEQLIPHPIAEINLDFQVIKPSIDHPNFADVVLAACHRKHIEQRIRIVQAAHLKTVVIDVDTLAIENACTLLALQAPQAPQFIHAKTTAIIDIGMCKMTLLVFNNGHAIYTAQHALTEYQTSAKNQPQQAINTPFFLADLVQHIQRGLRFFFSAQPHHEQLDHVVLAGGCANLHNIQQAVENELHIRTSVAQLFDADPIAAHIDKALLKQDQSKLLLACGLALRAFD